MIYLLGRSISQGKKAGIAAAIGINIGGYFHLLAAILGISVVIATSAIAFTILKWCGAAYLIYIGVQAFRQNVFTAPKNNMSLPKISIETIFWQGFISDVLNPKVAIFFISLLPQFIKPGLGNTTSQLLLLGVTVNIIALTINIFIVILAHSVTNRLRQSNHLSSVLNKLMGSLFIGLGVRLANEQQ